VPVEEAGGIEAPPAREDAPLQFEAHASRVLADDAQDALASSNQRGLNRLSTHPAHCTGGR